MSKPQLEILTGDLQGRRYLVEDSEFVIGRAPSCDLVIPKRYISREHARITKDGRDYTIEGLSETNPVLVEQRPVKPGRALGDGDEFEVCGIRIRFRLEGGAVSPRHAGTAVGGSDGSTSTSGKRDPSESDAGGDEPTSAKPVRRRRDEPEESDEKPVARGREDDSDDRPAARGREDDSDSGPTTPPRGVGKGDPKGRPIPPTQQSAAALRSSPGKVVFGADDDDEPKESAEERTAELPRASVTGSTAARGKAKGGDPVGSAKTGVLKGSVKGSTAGGAKGGSQTGGSKASGAHGESSNERTAELGKAKDPDDPDYDPFAEVEGRKKKAKTVDPQREKALRFLMVVGLLGIAVAAGILYKVTRKPPWSESISDRGIRCSIGQTVRFEEPFAKDDPPSGRPYVTADGEPSEPIHADAVCEVEWVVPHLKNRAIFLIRGKEAGETEFRIRFEDSRRIRVFKVVVEGDDLHDVARERRRADLKATNADALRAAADAAFQNGEGLSRERDVTSKEGNYRLALLRFQEAADAAVALRNAQAATGSVRPEVVEMVKKCEDAEKTARDDYQKFVDREFANYKSAVASGDVGQAILQLKRTLRAIAHDCDPRFMRMRLLLEEAFDVPWDGDGNEVCPDKRG